MGTQKPTLEGLYELVKKQAYRKQMKKRKAEVRQRLLVLKAKAEKHLQAKKEGLTPKGKDKLNSTSNPSSQKTVPKKTVQYSSNRSECSLQADVSKPPDGVWTTWTPLPLYSPSLKTTPKKPSS